MTTNKGLFTSKRDDWETPQELFDKLDKEFHFQLDPCATDKTAKCKKYFTKADDGLSKDWFQFKSIFMNPPYGSEISRWLKKANDEAAKGAIVVCLVPSRTDTKWWWRYCQDNNLNQSWRWFQDGYEADENLMVKRTVRFIKGRLKFSGKGSAPFPSAIVILEPAI